MTRDPREQDNAANPRNAQPPRFEEQTHDDLGLGAELRGYERIERNNQNTTDDADRPAALRDYDRNAGWSGGYGDQRTDQEHELTEHDADAHRSNESVRDPRDETRTNDNRAEDAPPSDPDTDEPRSRDTRPY